MADMQTKDRAASPPDPDLPQAPLLVERPRAVHLAVATIANHAEVRDGLLYISGAGVDRILAPAFPATLGCCAVLLFLVSGGGGDLEVVGLLLGEGGERVGETVEHFTLRDDVSHTSIPYVVHMAGTVVPAPGRYRFVVGADGEPVGEIGFVVALADTAPEGPSS